MKLKKPLEIFRRFDYRSRPDSHGQESADKQNGGAPNLSVSETFAVNPGGESHCTGGTEKLKRLGERYANLSDCYIVKDMRQRNAAHGGDDQNEVNVRSCVKRSANFSKRERERKQQDRSDQADHSEAANRAKLPGRPFHEDAIKRPTKCGGKCDEQPGKRDVSRLPSGLKPDNTKSAN